MPEPAVPRHAATVLLLRDTDDGLAVHLLRRRMSLAFAAGVHVFPGGALDDADFDVPSVTLSADWTSRLAPADESMAAALIRTAVRETAEETGVLLAVDEDGKPPTALTDDERTGLLAGSLTLTELLDRRGLRLDPAGLVPWARWVTPASQPKRYDTRFLVAALPAGQEPSPDAAGSYGGGEAEADLWITPAEAIRRYQDGDLALMIPTLVTLGELAEHADVASVVAAAHAWDWSTREIRP